MKKTNNKGFSLIELIIVIAIMAVLVAVIAPTLTQYLGKSKTKTDKSNANEICGQIQNAITDFESDDGAIGTATITLTWAGGGKTCTMSPAAPTGYVAVGTGASAKSLADYVNAIITSPTKSKEKPSQATTATITPNTTTGGYTVNVTVGTQSASNS